MFKSTTTQLLLGAAALGLAACATSTPYAPAEDGRGYGFTDQKIEDDRYRITFRGNSQTSREAVETYLLLRAAELTLENGYDHFVVVEDDTDKTTTYTGTTGAGFGPAFGPGLGFYGVGRAFPYYGFGYPWGAGFVGGGFVNDVNIRPRDRYTALAYIVMGRGDKPAGEIAAYDARQVEQNLRTVVEAAQERS